MKSDEPLTFPDELLEEYAEQVEAEWANPNVGSYSEQSAWLDLDTVSQFSYVLERVQFFKSLEDALYYIQNPGKFCNEYSQFYRACEVYLDNQALLKIAEAIVNE